MASGKLSPRQKMINMMYLVLTAMLALNVSRDILKALTRLNDSLETTVATVESKNQEIYSDFAAAAADNPEKAQKWKNKADQVKKESQELYAYIENMKKELVKISGGRDENGAPKRLSALEDPANYLLNQGNGKKLQKKLEAYESSLVSTLGDDAPQLQKNLKKTFDTSPQKVGDKKLPWPNASFEHFPLGAILPFLSDLQAKVRNSESDVISQLRSNIGKSDLKFTDIQVIVDEEKKYVTKGETYRAKVFLGAYDKTQKPKITINGKQLPESKIQNGQGIVEIPANKIGQVEWGGKIAIEQLGRSEPLVREIEPQTFTVAPQTVVVSPTKMNVLYRGVKNPLEIGVPGVAPDKIKASGPGLSGSEGAYVADVTDIRGKEVTINVSVLEETKDGKTETRPAGSKKFRIKGLPPAVGTIYTRSTGEFSKGAISRAEVEAEFKDFPFDLPLKVTGFEVAIPGYPPERVNGNSMPSNVKQRIQGLDPGTTISIRNIKARAIESGARVTEVGNISVDVN